MRHKKCDEERPTCRRCQTDLVVCDGYPHVPAQSTLYNVPSAFYNTPFASEASNCSGPKARFFHHFRTCTCADLAETPGGSVFWTHYALPLAHYDPAVAKSIAAAGVVHRIFIDRELGRTASLNRAALRLYNGAINSITSSPYLKPESIMVCCLLFICYESMTGRYAEAIRHLKAGLKLLATNDIRTGIRDSNFARELLYVFVRVSLEVSIFLEDQPLPLGVSFNWAVFAYEETCPFRDLAEAEQAMRKFDIDSVQDIKLLLDLGSHHTEPSSPEHEDAKRLALDALSTRLEHWNAHFDPLVKEMGLWHIRAEELNRLNHLRLQQTQWLTVLGIHLQEQTFVDRACATYLDLIKGMAQSLISRRRRTFSIDGVLISGLSLVVSATSCPDIQKHACLLLHSLDRREGLWDSREILELHQATLSQHDPRSWYALPVAGGIPAYMKSLSLFSNAISADNALVQTGCGFYDDDLTCVDGSMMNIDDKFTLD